MAKMNFILNGQGIDYGEIADQVRCHEVIRPRQSHCYFCPHCGSIWAKVTVSIKDKISEYVSYTIPCAKHNTKTVGEIPGSFYLTWDKEFNESFPYSMIQYEFFNAIKQTGVLSW